MADRKVTLHGDPLTLAGTQVNVGDAAPEFAVLDNELRPVTLADIRGRVTILCSVPSLDTPVCDTEARRFNKEAAKLGEVAIKVISVDLPFAQVRWCGAAGIENVQTLSDYHNVDFGRAFGVLIEELRLLARAIFVLDADGVIKYTELVSEMAEEPNYDAALKAAKKLL